jgi:hypothetical protein
MKKIITIAIFLFSSQLNGQILLTTIYENHLRANPDMSSRIVKSLPAHKDVELIDYIADGQFSGYFKVNVFGSIGYINRHSVYYDDAYYLALKVKNGNVNQIYIDNKDYVDKLNQQKRFEEELWAKQNFKPKINVVIQEQTSTVDVNSTQNTDNSNTTENSVQSNHLGQNFQDLKDYISEKIKASSPLPNHANNIFFSNNILRSDAESLVGRKLSEDEFNYLFIYVRDVYFDESREKWAWAVAECLDIRGITKVTATRITGDDNYCKITLYMNGHHLSKVWSKSIAGNQPSHKDISKMEIMISDDINLANSIKRAIISMCEHYGISVSDGDKF